MACGGDHALALSLDGAVLSWGWAELGQLGRYEASRFSFFRSLSHRVFVQGPATPPSAASLARWRCLDARAPSLREVTRREENRSELVCSPLCSGYGHSGAVLEDGRVFGWGWSRHGQLGAPTSEPFLAAPVLLPVTDVVSVCSGSFKHTVFLRSDGSVVGLGSNAFLQIKNV